MEQNAAKYIRDNYSPKYHRKGYKVCTPEKYFNAGGLDIMDSKVVEKHSTNYQNIQSSDLIKDILSMVLSNNKES